jgi:hypothetical protein
VFIARLWVAWRFFKDPLVVVSQKISPDYNFRAQILPWAYVWENTLFWIIQSTPLDEMT